MYRYIFLTAILLFIPGIKQAQKQNLVDVASSMISRHQFVMDSLNKALTEATDDTTRIRIRMALCDECDVAENLKYCEPTLKLIDKILPGTTNKKLKNKLLADKAMMYRTLLMYYSNDEKEKNKTEKQIDCIQKALAIYKEINDTSRVMNTYFTYENMYFYKGDVSKQIQILKEALQYMQSVKSDLNIGRIYNRLGRVYRYVGDTATALDYLQKTLNYSMSHLDKKWLPRIYYETAGSYFGLMRYNSSLKYYHLARSMYKEEKNEIALNLIYKELGNLYLNKNVADSAMYYYKTGLDLAYKLNDMKSVFLDMIFMGQVYLLQGKYKEAIKQHGICLDAVRKVDNGGGLAQALYNMGRDNYKAGQYSIARKFAAEALDISEKKLAVEDVIQRTELMHQIDSAMGNFKSAYFFQNKLSLLKKQLNTEEIKRNSAKEKYQQEIREQAILARLEQEKRDAANKAHSQRQQLILFVALSILIIIMVFSFFLLRSLRITRKQKNIIEIQNQETESQKKIIEEKQHEILDSIKYAKRLQQAILPPAEYINAEIPDNFILYKPKDIVAGDFYWAETTGDYFLIAAADSTGHGVPGAMVSVVCSGALNRSVKEFGLTDTGKILDKTRELVIATFEKSQSEVKDGMDISLLCINRKNNTITWSGANNPLWYLQDNELKEIKADKQPIGKSDHQQPFTTHTIAMSPGTIFYLFTDGLADQFGGPLGKKFKYKQFEELLASIQHSSMGEQCKVIEQKFEEWKGGLEQVDDVCVIGVKTKW